MTFNVALSGMNAARSDLNTTANNIANSRTTGFKQSRTEFADVYGATANGVGRSAVGSGVQVASVDQQFTQGAVEFTDNGLDLAINGEGFFTLSDNGTTVYSRAGAFGVDKDGYVGNAQGHRVQVFAYNANGTFNTGQTTDLQITTDDNPPAATARANLDINLPASAQVATASIPVNQTAVDPATFDANNPNTYNHTTSLTVYDSQGAPHVASLYFIKSEQQNEWYVRMQINGQDREFANYDATGAVDPNNSQSALTLAFDNNGQLVPGSSDPVRNTASFHVAAQAGGGTPTPEQQLGFEIDLDGLTQFSDQFSVNSLQQNGYSTGRLIGVDIDNEGIVYARYTNGQAEPRGQLVLTNFANPQGLQQLGDTSWAETFQSGQAQVGTSGSSNFGQIQAGALESSNVNLAEQLVNMIISQRNFQANAQMIQTEDQVTQTVINLR